HHPVVHRERRAEPPRAACAGREERMHAQDRKARHAVDLDEATGVAKDHRANQIRPARGNFDRCGAADRASDQDRRPGSDERKQLFENAGIAARACRCGVGRAATLPRPVDGDDLETAADARGQRLVVARAMTGRMKTHDGRPPAASRNGHARSGNVMKFHGIPRPCCRAEIHCGRGARRRIVHCCDIHITMETIESLAMSQGLSTPPRSRRAATRGKRSAAAPRQRATTAPERGAARDALLAAARKEFDEAGFEGTDTNRIARRAGYAPQTFYRHFHDKTAIFVEIYNKWFEDEWKDLEKAHGKGADGAARVLLDHHARHREFRRSLRRLT